MKKLTAEAEEFAIATVMGTLGGVDGPPEVGEVEDALRHLINLLEFGGVLEREPEAASPSRPGPAPLDPMGKGGGGTSIRG